MATSLIDRRVSVLDDDGDLITLSNRFPVSISGSVSISAVLTARHGEVDYLGTIVPVQLAYFQSTALGNATVVAGEVGKKIRGLSAWYTVLTGTSATVEWRSGAAAIRIAGMNLPSTISTSWDFGPEGFWIETNSGQDLVIRQSQTVAAARVVGYVTYIKV